ncbi:shikimate dehydrogenase [Rhodovulum sp. BSW8]|uniref:Shikimate dehydrogenase (NADP(+)) n=1 Tax=Rhodovulum visakhapatnamense TaxID=364297 RepID=A0A4R8G6X9_9RHOB|nr:MULTISPECIES: shikimate dehydrogenase [Rhodovulum]OLS43210.1 shikimate dehydrogenase [Rhodovulum sulfidophilum]MBL3568260.1 shikimate dehydrogenase [Rhodovulum visakhapatnamense]MBL3576602.1 shikimate dehydrogenase [Rhodovulum visakhapatnamense]RBO53269.1 shikimate dehydrogenase [Rhodovulum sp. BSW8]TDX31932.1 shikimate dehydrogenase [Rhodovulum visakhapatnamense]
MSDRIPLAGVIGSPIAHSKSPLLHRHWLERYGIRGFYIPMDVAHADLKQVLEALPRMGFVGINVTIPHKETILSLADSVSDRAALIGSANTLIFRADGKVYADNTDGIGFIENLRQGAPGWDPTAGPAAVLGAGGAARAVVAALSEQGVREIRVSNRTRSRAEALRAEFGPKIVVHDWVQAAAMIDGAATVVNTTSLGMVGKAEFKVPLDALSPDAVVSDLVYVPLETAFLREARARGCVAVDGLGMLLHQAAPGFERWFGRRPEVDEAARAVLLDA